MPPWPLRPRGPSRAMIRIPDKRPKRPRDLNQWAKRMVDLATGNAQETDPYKGKDASAVNLGRRGGLKGGKARAAKMTAERRAEIARKAAKGMRFQKKSKITDTRWRYISCTTISFASMTLRTTPAMAAGVTKRLWEISDIVDVLEAREAAHA